MVSWFKNGKANRIYMDNASTTPIDGRVLRAMNNVYENHYFNPGGLYKEAIETKNIISDARKSIAKLLGTTSEHVVFTRGGTESNNLAIFGVIEQWKKNNPGVIPHVIMSEIEHSAVIETARSLAKKLEIHLSVATVTSDGLVDVDGLKKILRPTTILISIMYVNNEIGTIQPIKEITKLVRWYKKTSPDSLRESPSPCRRGSQSYPLVYCDAIQAGNYLDINVERLGVDLMSLSGSKIYGPKSSGILYIRNNELVSPMLHGGDQEFGLRAGTEDVAQIVGLTKALEITREISEKENARLLDLQKFFFAELEKSLTDYKVNGAFLPLLEGVPRGAGVGVRVCNNINISIEGVSSERLVIELDAQGICAASQSACRSDSDEESYVIDAIRQHQKSDTAEGSIRFTMGRGSKKGDVEGVVKVLAEIVNKIRVFDKTLTSVNSKVM